jgi:hypothetical protein
MPSGVIATPHSVGGGQSYRNYIFGQPDATDFSYSGLNLFFDGNNSTPGISVYGPLNSLSFCPTMAVH